MRFVIAGHRRLEIVLAPGGQGLVRVLVVDRRMAQQAVGQPRQQARADDGLHGRPADPQFAPAERKSLVVIEDKPRKARSAIKPTRRESLGKKYGSRPVGPVRLGQETSDARKRCF